PVGLVRLARLKRGDALVDLVIPRHVRDKVLDHGKRAHRRDGDRLVRRVVGHAGHAHQLRLAVDLRRARAALPRFAVPAHREIGCLLGLDHVHRVEHHRAFAERDLIFLQFAARARAPEQSQSAKIRHHLPSLIRAMRSAGIGGCASRRTVMRAPSFLITICSRACFSSESGWSLRVWPPRLSVRSSPALSRMIPALRCITACSAAWTANGFSPSRSNGTSASCTACSTSWSGIAGAAPRLPAAYWPARRPNTSRSLSELPPSRLAPCMPPPTSPAAYRPGTVDSWVSASTLTPPMT